MQSMTGFASREGVFENHSWAWDIRSVNGKGLDLRLRVPDWLSELEPLVRKEVAKVAARGNVSLGLKVHRGTDDVALGIDAVALAAVLDAASSVEAAARKAGLAVGTPTSLEILSWRGVLSAADSDEVSEGLINALKGDLGALLADFANARADEGAALKGILERQLDEFRALFEAARDVLPERRAEADAKFRAALDKILEDRDGIDEGRVAQEMAILAVKADVAEELDRLSAHIDAAAALIEETAPVGRKFDFLMQEFNREVNTLCSKSGHAGLTEIGLSMKVLIDQMREQVQNVE